MKRISALVRSLGTAAAILLLGMVSAQAATLTISNTADTGVGSLRQAIITAVFPSHERGKGLGMLTTAVAIGATAGPIVAGPLIQWFGWRSVFVFLAIPTSLAIFVAIRVLDDERIGSGFGDRCNGPRRFG